MHRQLQLLVLLATVAGSPALVSAALILHVDQKEVAPSASDQIVYLDVYLEDPDNIDEMLRAFTFRAVGSGFTPNGVRIVPPASGIFPPASAAHPYVLEGSGFIPEDFGSTYDVVQAGAGGEHLFISNVGPSLNGLLAVPVLVPAGVQPGTYDLLVDSAQTQLFFLGPTITFTVAGPGRITVTPEPGALAPAALAASLLLRRRGAKR